MFVKLSIDEGGGGVKVRLLHAKVPDSLSPGSDLTKDDRHKMLNVGDVSGKRSMLCEKYQRQMVEDGTGTPCTKSGNLRINPVLNIIDSIKNPYKIPGGFDWTEDFDGKQCFNDHTFLINFKSTVGSGGGQLRCLKLVYEFIKAQVGLIDNQVVSDQTYFVNILDGTVAGKYMHQFTHILSDKDDKIKERIYIGDLHGYFEWLNNILETIL